MIRKIHLVSLCLIFLFFLGNVSGQEIENKTEDMVVSDEYSEMSYLKGQDIDMYYKDGTSYEVQLVSNDSSIAYENINITVNGKTYSKTTNDSGFVKLSLNLNPGEYDVKSTCIFNNRQLSTLNHVKISIMNTTLMGQKNIEMGYKTDKYSVQLLGGNGTALANKEIVFEIQGMKYIRTTDENGIGSLNINLNIGHYQIKAYYLGEPNVMKSNVVNSPIVVKRYSSKLNANNSILEYKNGKFSAILLSENDVPLKNAVVRFAINGCEYERATDENGTASLNINLYEGSYNIRYYFDGNEGFSSSWGISSIEVVKNKIAIKADDLETYYSDSNCYIVNVENSISGKSIENLDLRVDVYQNNDFMKSFYSKTNSDGLARIFLNLNPGNYTLSIKPTNENYVGQKNSNIKINHGKAIAIASDLVLNRKGDPYTIKLIDDLTGLPIADKTVKITVSGKTYLRTTDVFGIAKLNINLDNGEYIVKYEFYDEGYNKIDGFNKIVRTDCILNTDLKVLKDDITRRGTYLEVKLTDCNGIPLKNKEIQFFINGVEYIRMTDIEGIAKLKINLNDGNYMYSIRFSEKGLFNLSSINGNLLVNTTADFSYSIVIPTYETINNKRFTVCHSIELQYLDKSYEFGYQMGDYIDLNNYANYFISENGLQYSNDLSKQGLNIRVDDDKINITFSGRLRGDLDQFSVTGKSQNLKEVITIVLNNEIVATVTLSEKHYFLDEIKDYFNLISSNENIYTILKTSENTVERSLQLFYGDPLLEEQKIDEDYEFIQTYVISKDKVNQNIMNSAINKGLIADWDYEKYAYELFVAGLITTFAADTSAEELARDFNITWNKKENIVLLTRDWLGLSCHSLVDVEGQGNDTMVKNFYLNYGLLYATYEQLGIYFTGNEAVSAVSEIFDGIINGNESFIVENDKGLWTIRLVNSTNRIEINKTTGKVKTILDSKYYMPLKGAISKNEVWTGTDPSKTFGYILRNLNQGFNGAINVLCNAMNTLSTTVSYGTIGTATNIAALKSLCYGGKIMKGASFVGICYTMGNLVVDYRNNHASEESYQYFSYHSNSLNSKTVHIFNPNTQYIDCIEMPIENGKINMDKSIYIDSVTGKRDLSEEEKIKYENYDK